MLQEMLPCMLQTSAMILDHSWLYFSIKQTVNESRSHCSQTVWIEKMLPIEQSDSTAEAAASSAHLKFSGFQFSSVTWCHTWTLRNTCGAMDAEFLIERRSLSAAAETWCGRQRERELKGRDALSTDSETSASCQVWTRCLFFFLFFFWGE